MGVLKSPILLIHAGLNHCAALCNGELLADAVRAFYWFSPELSVLAGPLEEPLFFPGFSGLAIGNRFRKVSFACRIASADVAFSTLLLLSASGSQEATRLSGKVLLLS